jgi:hypothetical protein
VHFGWRAFGIEGVSDWHLRIVVVHVVQCCVACGRSYAHAELVIGERAILRAVKLDVAHIQCCFPVDMVRPDYLVNQMC